MKRVNKYRSVCPNCGAIKSKEENGYTVCLNCESQIEYIGKSKMSLYPSEFEMFNYERSPYNVR